MIVVYSKPGCGYCVKAKNWLAENGFVFEEVDVTIDPSDYVFLVDQGHKKLPQIYARDGYGSLKLLVSGGFDGLSALTPDELRAKLVTP